MFLFYPEFGAQFELQIKYPKIKLNKTLKDQKRSDRLIKTLDFLIDFFSSFFNS
jgi:hypothetical protein